MKEIDVSSFIKKVLIPHVDYKICRAEPATGIIYVINNFISGHLRLLGKGGGAYPHKYLEMIDSVFGKDDNTIEVCAGMNTVKDAVTVDIRLSTNPHVLDDAQKLSRVKEKFTRWRCDPPYNAKTAKEMYGTAMPSYIKLLKAGARVIEPGSLMFLLCTTNYQHHPEGVKRIGLILITIVPNNEIRALNIYLKLKKEKEKVTA
jgi:hypothetical protein